MIANCKVEKILTIQNQAVYDKSIMHMVNLSLTRFKK